MEIGDTEVFGHLAGVTKDGLIVIRPEPGTDIRKISTYGSGQVHLEIDDGRKRTIEQLRKAHALFADIAKERVVTVPEVKDLMRAYYYKKYRKEMPSESVATITEQRNFIEVTIDFCFEQNIPFAGKTLAAIRDDYGFQFRCLMKRQCVICGERAEYCHVEAVGSGNNRNRIDHSKHHFMSLCWKEHRRQHDMGIWTFIKTEHIKPISLTDEQCVELGIESKKTMYYFREMEQQLLLRGEFLEEK